MRTENVFTARSEARMCVARCCCENVVCLSVCPSVMLVDCDQSSFNSRGVRERRVASAPALSHGRRAGSHSVKVTVVVSVRVSVYLQKD